MADGRNCDFGGKLGQQLIDSDLERFLTHCGSCLLSTDPGHHLRNHFPLISLAHARWNRNHDAAALAICRNVLLSTSRPDDDYLAL
jgi:hypothetical protein